MQIKEIPAGERPREKMLYYGADALSNSELLALVIRSGGHDKSALDLADEVIRYASSELGGLERASVRELITIDGIGESKACSIIAGLELSRRIRDAGRQEARPIIHSIEDAADLLKDEFEAEKREHLVELVLNARGEVEAKLTISIGALSSSVAEPREVFSAAIRMGAAAIIIAHNHPSGDPNPSQDDIETTKRLVEVSKIVGIVLIDHIIIGRGSYVSLRERGCINNL